MAIFSSHKPKFYFLCFLILFLQQKGYSQTDAHTETHNLRMVITYNLSQPTDTLILHYGTVTINDKFERQIAVRDSDGNFTFSIKSENPYGYFRLIKARQTRKNDNRILLNNLFWESGDDLKIDITERTYPTLPLIIADYSGNGSLKYKAWDEIERKTPELMTKLRRGDPNYRWDDVAKEKLTILEKYQNIMSNLSFDILKIKILMREWMGATIAMTKVFPAVDSQKVEAERLKTLYYPMKNWGTSEQALANSQDYINFYSIYFRLYPVYKQAKYDKDKYPIVNIDAKSTFDLISISSKGTIRQALIVKLLNDLQLPSYDSTYLEGKEYLKDTYYLRQLEDSNTKKNIFNYSFIDTNGLEIKLSKYKDKVLFIDTWFSGCPGCAHYYKTIGSKLEQHFSQEQNLAMLSISSDGSRKIWTESITKGIYTNSSSLNLYTGGKKMNHPFYRDFGIHSGPTILLADKNGDLLYFNTKELYDLNALIKAIESLL